VKKMLFENIGAMFKTNYVQKNIETVSKREFDFLKKSWKK
jgi:hypothetical protein